MMNNGETNQFNNLIDFFEDAGESIKLSNDDKLTEDQCKNLIDSFENYSPEQSINYLLDEIEKKKDLVSDFEQILGRVTDAIEYLINSDFEAENKESLLNILMTNYALLGLNQPIINVARLITLVIDKLSDQTNNRVNLFRLSLLYGYKERTWNPTYFKCTSIKCDSAFIDRGYNNDDNTYSISQPHTGIYGLLWLLLKHLNEFENDYKEMLVKEFPHKLHKPIVNDPQWGLIADPDGTFSFKDGKYIYFTIKNNDEPEHSHSPGHCQSKTMKRTAGTYGLTKRGKLLEKILKSFLYLSATILITDYQEDTIRFAPRYDTLMFGNLFILDGDEMAQLQDIPENIKIPQRLRMRGFNPNKELENIINDDKTGDKASKECLLQNILYILDPSSAEVADIDPTTQIGGRGDVCGMGRGMGRGGMGRGMGRGGMGRGMGRGGMGRGMGRGGWGMQEAAEK